MMIFDTCSIPRPSLGANIATGYLSCKPSDYLSLRPRHACRHACRPTTQTITTRKRGENCVGVAHDYQSPHLLHRLNRLVNCGAERCEIIFKTRHTSHVSHTLRFQRGFQKATWPREHESWRDVREHNWPSSKRGYVPRARAGSRKLRGRKLLALPV